MKVLYVCRCVKCYSFLLSEKKITDRKLPDSVVFLNSCYVHYWTVAVVVNVLLK